MTIARKRVVFGSLVTILGLITWFFMRLSGETGVVSRDAAMDLGSGFAVTAGEPDREHEIKMLTAQLEKKPDHVPVLFRLAQLERESGQLTRAIDHLRRAVGQEPSNFDARLELGRTLYENGQIEEAIAETQRILEANPDQVDALYNLGAIYANLGDPAKARFYWSAAVAAAPEADSGRKARDALRVLAEGSVRSKG